MKQVYILLSRTGTLPSRFIHKMTGGTFTHASVALIPQTDRFYSYARRSMRNPLHAGLIVENIHTQIFALYPHCHCSLYALEVSDEAYERMKQCITYFMEHYKKAKYNFLGTLPLRLGIRWKRKFRLTCSQFVALILSSSAEIELPKDPYLMLPNDFIKIKSLKHVYSGILKDCCFPAFSEQAQAVR